MASKAARTETTDTAGSVLARTCLREPMDILLSDDAATMHRVTPITPAGPERAWRDVLVVAYSRL